MKITFWYFGTKVFWFLSFAVNLFKVVERYICVKIFFRGKLGIQLKKSRGLEFMGASLRVQQMIEYSR